MSIIRAILGPTQGEIVEAMRAKLEISKKRGAQGSTSWLARCREWVRRYDPVRPEMMEGLHHYGFVRRLSELLPANAIIVSDTGGNVIMMGHAFRSKAGQRIFSSNGNSAMGTAFCSAIGAWFAAPDRPIICLIGDGGFQLNSQELQTLFHYNANVKVFILNNHCLGNTRAWQVQNERRQLACGPDGYSCPDFVRVAQAYGVEGWQVGVDWRADLPQILALPVAIVVDVPHDMFCDYQPRMTLWTAGIEEGFPLLPEAEFEKNMTVAPIDGWRERRAHYKEMPDV